MTNGAIGCAVDSASPVADLDTRSAHKEISPGIGLCLCGGDYRAMLFGVPEFKYYALADGMSALLSRHPGKQRPQQDINSN